VSDILQGTILSRRGWCHGRLMIILSKKAVYVVLATVGNKSNLICGCNFCVF